MNGHHHGGSERCRSSVWLTSRRPELTPSTRRHRQGVVGGRSAGRFNPVPNMPLNVLPDGHRRPKSLSLGVTHRAHQSDRSYYQDHAQHNGVRCLNSGRSRRATSASISDVTPA